MARYGCLLVSAPDGAQQIIGLDYAKLTCGSDPDNDLVLSDEEIAPHHGRIECDERGCLIVDLGSGNGTFLNGRRVMVAALVNNDVFQIGNHTLTYVEPNGPTD